MNIHEYQAKHIVSQYGIKIPKGHIAYTPLEAKRAALSASRRGPWMLKAQIQSGARDKGYFVGLAKGSGSGIRLIKSRHKLVQEAAEMLGGTLITPQTDQKGKTVTRIYVEAYHKIRKIFYTGFVIDRMNACITLLIAKLDKGDIMTTAAKYPEQILRLNLDLQKGAKASQITQVAKFLGMRAKNVLQLKKYLQGLFKVFIDKDALMLEINPAGIDKHGDIIALDAKLSVDDKALFRQKDIEPLFDAYEMEERELRAAKNGFQYRSFTEGSVGCIVNGDGIALAAMDLIRSHGWDTSCFLNVKGGVDRDKIAAGIKLIMTNPRVEGILINVLGGFLRCNLVADGIIAAASEVGLNVPLVVRFEGTNKEEAKQILENSRLPVIVADDMEDSVIKLLQAMEESD